MVKKKVGCIPKEVNRTNFSKNSLQVKKHIKSMKSQFKGCFRAKRILFAERCSLWVRHFNVAYYDEFKSRYCHRKVNNVKVQVRDVEILQSNIKRELNL